MIDLDKRPFGSIWYRNMWVNEQAYYGNLEQIDKIIDKVKSKQPERSKREDLERGCGALNTMET